MLGIFIFVAKNMKSAGALFQKLHNQTIFFFFLGDCQKMKSKFPVLYQISRHKSTGGEEIVMKMQFIYRKMN